MPNLGYFGLLLERDFVIAALSAIAAFATVLTLAYPLLTGNALNARMKTVTTRRDELRRSQREAFAAKARKGQLRNEPVGLMKRTVEKLNLQKFLQSPADKERLARAGFRAPRHVIAFTFFRLLLPPAAFACTAIYVFLLADLEWIFPLKAAVAIGGATLGYYLPDVFISNRIQKRQQSIMRAFPDALDLLLICVQSGMSVEAAFNRVSTEIGSQSSELAEELALTTAELSYLPDRRVAFSNLAGRSGHPGVKAVCAALVQSEKYGTPVGQALRATAQENREMRMAEAERKAAALPPKLTVPMMLFFLPCLFIVILGPAAIQYLQL
nr:MAG: type II secretion system F family protein [Hyphomicrobiales bacterium]